MIGEYEDVHLARPEIVTVHFPVCPITGKCLPKAHKFIEAVLIAISFELQYQLGRDQCSLLSR